MLINHSMRFGTDEFAFSKQALLEARQPFDTTGYTSCEGFTIAGSEPAGTSRRFIFKVDDELFYFVDGAPVTFNHSKEFEDVIQYGNTAAEVNAVTNIPDWLGKKIYPIIALQAPLESIALPTAALTLKVRSSTELYDKTVESAEYELATDGGTPRIAEISSSVTTTGNAEAIVTCSLKIDGTWSDWMNLSAAKDKEATAVKFKLYYKVSTLDGSDTAKVNSVTIKHTLGSSAVSGDIAELYSVVKDYYHDLQTCYLVLKHKKLIDSTIAAYVNFLPKPKTRSLIFLGTSNGLTQNFTLGVDGVADENIDHNTLRIFADGTPVMNFDYNVKTSHITLTLPAGKAITASYDYDHAKEIWRQMIKDIDQQPYDDGTFMTRFSYSLPDDITDQKSSNLRINLTRPTGTVENQSLGKATGLVQQFPLPHAAKQDTIELNADWSYDPDTQIITCVATKNTELVLSYDWLGESQTIYAMVAGWSVV